MKSAKSILKATADQFRIPPERWEQVPGAVSQLITLATSPRFLLTLDIDIVSGQLRGLVSSNFPNGGTTDEFARLSTAMTQVAQYFQQRAIAVAKQEGANGKAASDSGEVGQPNDGNPKPQD